MLLMKAQKASLQENTIGDKLAKEVMETFRQVNRNALGCALAGEHPKKPL